MTNSPNIEDVKKMLFKKYPKLENDYKDNFKEHLLEQYKLAFESLDSIKNIVLGIAKYNVFIHSFIISGVAYCFLNCSLIYMVLILSCIGTIISLNWLKVDSDFQNRLKLQELICMAIEENLPCLLISTGEKLKEKYYKKRWYEKILNKIRINNLSRGLAFLYIFTALISLYYIIKSNINCLL